MTLNLRIPQFFWWLPLSGAHQSAAIEAELLAVVAHASKSNWLQTRQPDLRLLDEATIKRFLQRDQNIVHSAESAPLRRFLAMLREIGVAPAKPPEPKSDQRRFFGGGVQSLVKGPSAARSRLQKLAETIFSCG
jgi:hypothetical protein